MDNNVLTQGYSNSEWDNFVKGELLIFMQKHQIEKINADDGNGKKARINKNSNGEYKVSTTLNETL